MALCFSCSSSSSSGDGGMETLEAGGVDDHCSDNMPCTLTVGMMASDYLLLGEHDPWTFMVPTAGQIIHLVVSMEAAFTPVRLEVALFAPMTATSTKGEHAIRTDTWMGNGKQKIDMQVLATVAGTYKVVVSDANGQNMDRHNPYYILVTLQTDMDMNEPNNTPMQATPLTPGTPISGTIGYQGDQDWFKLMVPTGKLINVQLSAAAPSTGSGEVLQYEIFDPTGMNRIAQTAEPGGTAIMLKENRAVSNMAGTYFIKISDATGMHSDLGRVYQLTAGLLDEPDTHEPNNDVPHATRLMAGPNTITGYIASKADLDYYAVNVPSASMMTPQLITVQATMPASVVPLQIEVLMPDGVTTVCADDPECKAVRFTADGMRCPVNGVQTPMNLPANLATSHPVTSPGVYLIAVRAHQDQAYDIATPYTITIDTPTEPDMFERYETDRSMARLIPPATSTAGTTIQYPWVSGYISYAGDQDWFAFDFPGPMNAPVGQNGDWLVQIELQKGGPSPVELQMFFAASDMDYGVYGEQCSMPVQGACDPTGCQIADNMNIIDALFGENAVPTCFPPTMTCNSPFGQSCTGDSMCKGKDCIIVFREHTGAGPHFFRMTDLNRDDYDVRTSISPTAPGIPLGQYRFRITLTAKCPPMSACTGMYTDAAGNDLCLRP
jgi:hypothetical protein